MKNKSTFTEDVVLRVLIEASNLRSFDLEDGCLADRDNNWIDLRALTKLLNEAAMAAK